MKSQVRCERRRFGRMPMHPIQQAARRLHEIDIRLAVNQARTWPVLLTLAVASLGAALLWGLSPALGRAALERLADPFGSGDWPRRTDLAVVGPSRIARGEPF